MDAGVLDALRGAEDALVASDARGGIVFCNDKAAALLGHAPGTLEGAPLTAIMPERMRARHEAAMGKYVESRTSRLMGRPILVPALRGDGSEVDIELTMRVFEQAGAPDLVVATLRPASEAHTPSRDVKRLETALQRRAYELV